MGEQKCSQAARHLERIWVIVGAVWLAAAMPGVLITRSCSKSGNQLG